MQLNPIECEICARLTMLCIRDGVEAFASAEDIARAYSSEATVFRVRADRQVKARKKATEALGIAENFDRELDQDEVAEAITRLVKQGILDQEPGAERWQLSVGMRQLAGLSDED